MKTRVRCPAGATEKIPIKVGVYQGSVLSPLLFIIVLEGKVLESDVVQLLFADDGAIVSKDPVVLQRVVNVWADVFQNNGFRMSIKKTEKYFSRNKGTNYEFNIFPLRRNTNFQSNFI